MPVASSTCMKRIPHLFFSFVFRLKLIWKFIQVYQTGEYGVKFVMFYVYGFVCCLSMKMKQSGCAYFDQISQFVDTKLYLEKKNAFTIPLHWAILLCSVSRFWWSVLRSTEADTLYNFISYRYMFVRIFIFTLA